MAQAVVSVAYQCHSFLLADPADHMANIPRFDPNGFIRADGKHLSYPHFRELQLRLVEEARAAGDILTPHEVQGLVFRGHGQHCFRCNGEIVLHYKGPPLYRRLDPDDTNFPQTHGYFHDDCWQEYQRGKNNKKRRARYRLQRDGDGNVPANAAAAPLAIENAALAIEDGALAIADAPLAIADAEPPVAADTEHVHPDPSAGSSSDRIRRP